MVTLVLPGQGPVQVLQWSQSNSHHAAVVESRHLVALELFPLEKSLCWHVLKEIEVPLLLGPLHAVVQHVLEVLLQLLVVYRAKGIPAGVGYLPRPLLHLFSLVPLSDVYSSDRKIISHPLHMWFSGHCLLFNGSMAINPDTFDTSTVPWLILK